MESPSDEECETPFTADLFAETFDYPRAMVRLAMECGLESPEGKITGVAFCRWLAAHYNDLRGIAGLPMLDIPAETMTAEERAYITSVNVLRTHLDYFVSRVSSLEYKEDWTNIS